MNTAKAGVGFSDSQDSFEAGRLAAREAVTGMGQKGGSLVLGFCTGRYDYQACFDGIRSEVGDIPIIGGPAIGIITNDRLGYDGYQVGVAVLPDDVCCDVAAVGGLDKGEKKAGLELGRQLGVKKNPKEKLALLFYDSIKCPPPPAPVLSVSSYLIDGLEEGRGDSSTPIVGAGLIGTYAFDGGKLFCGTSVADQHAVAALLSGECSVQTCITHGCKPMSDYHTITRVEGPVVYEIDGRPAVDVIDSLLGQQDWHKRLPLLLVTLGVNHGQKYGPYDEKNYVNRLTVGIVPEAKAVVLFEADFENGAEFQFMRRNADLMWESAARGCRETVARLDENNLEPFFALYIDCAGRTAGFSGAEKEEASVVQEIVGARAPLLGFYSGVEIAPLLGRSRGLDWTGVLLVMSRAAKR